MQNKLRYVVGSSLFLTAFITFYLVGNSLGFVFIPLSLQAFFALLSVIGGIALFLNYLKLGYILGFLMSIMSGVPLAIILFLWSNYPSIAGEVASPISALLSLLLIFSIPILTVLASIWGLIMVYEKKIIEKPLGEEIELGTVKYTANGTEEKPAKENTKFVFVDLSITNITNASFTFPAAPFVLIDDKKRSFRPMAEAGDQYLTSRQLTPGKTEKGFIVYEIPTDAASYGISTGKKGTEEVYKVVLKTGK